MKKKRVHSHYNTQENRDRITAAVRQAIIDVLAGKIKRPTISNGNRKMGPIPSISLVPYSTCPHCCQETCGPDCYAAKMALMYCNDEKDSSTLTSWARNTALAVYKPDLYWKYVEKRIARSRFFRFHVGGDIPSPRYLGKMVEIARKYPSCQIIAFTKRHSWVNQYIDVNGDLPGNLHIILSGWEGLTVENPHNLPETNVIMPGMEKPDNWSLCGGNCSECAACGMGCWVAGAGNIIAFPLH